MSSAMSIHIINPLPSLGLLRKRQLFPYIKPLPAPTTYQEAIQNTVDSFSDAKRTLDWFFDVAGFQSSAADDNGIPSLSDRRKIYTWQDDDTYPPHLETIPWADSKNPLQIFDFQRLYDTIVIMFHLFVVDINNVESLGPAGSTTMKALEDRNRELHAEASEGLFHPQNMLTAPNIGLRDDWYTDAVFAQQSFTGPNPTTINLASDQWIQTFTQAANGNGAVLNLLKSAPVKSFYVQDYSYLRSAAGIQPTAQIVATPSDDGVLQYGCASVALFYLPPSGKLHPLAIIIDWKGSLEASVTIFNQRVVPDDKSDAGLIGGILGHLVPPVTNAIEEKNDWPWRYAKMCVQVSDWTRHEITVHLVDAHFVEEVTLVAAQRSFESTHPVYRLLKDHWTTTLSINALARSTLVPKVIKPLSGFTDSQVQQFINHEYSNFDWTGKYIPTDLEKRGFPIAELDSNPKYHNYGYGRDINLIWNTLRKFVSTVLTQYYTNGDAQVKNDSWVANFCQEMQSSMGGRMTQFPTITTLDGLIDAVTMCIHIASPQHTAINYLQQYYMTFVPNKPSCLYQPLPTTLADLQKIGESDVINALPIHQGQDQDWLLMAQLTYLLSPAVEEAINLTTFAKQVATDKDPIMAGAGKTLLADLDTLKEALKNVSTQLDDQTKEYDVLYPDQTARAIVI